MKTCAMFLDADPLSSKEIHAMKSASQIYGHVDVFLERKATTKRILFSYAEKVDIMRHDLSAENFSWDVHPVDVSKHDALKKAGIDQIAMIASTVSDFAKLYEQATMHFQLMKHCQVVFVPVKQSEDVSPKFIWQLVLDDAPEAVHLKYVSDYAWLRTKFKLVKKLSVQCPAEIEEKIAGVFRDRPDEFDVVQINGEDALSSFATAIEKTKKKCVVALSTSSVPAISAAADVHLQHGKRGSYWFGGDTAEASARSLIQLLGGKLKWMSSLDFF